MQLPPHVRAGRLPDAPTLAALQVRAQRARSRLLPQGALSGLTEAAVLPSWQDVLAGAAQVLVALDDTARGAAVGVAVCGQASDADRNPARDVELALLLVDPGATGRGHGSRLLAAVADTARSAGAGLLVTWVLEADEDLQHFLTGCGWDPDGSRRSLDAGGPVTEIRLQTRLQTGLPAALQPQPQPGR